MMLLAHFFLPWHNSPTGPRPPHCRGFTITLRHTTLGRISLDEWSARRRNLYLKTYNNHKRRTSMPAVGFEPKNPASERPQTYAFDCAVTGVGLADITTYNTSFCFHPSCWYPFTMWTVLRQANSSFQSEFSTNWDLM